jgi:hypothetical protein
MFGQTKLSPSLNVHIQAALRKQQAFEEWALDEMAQQVAAQEGQAALVKYEQQLAVAQPTEPQIDPATGQDMGPEPGAELPVPPSPTQFSPLKWRVWYSPEIHLQEFDKWANSDRIVELLTEKPHLEQLLEIHRQEIEMAMAQKMALMAPPSNSPGAQGEKGSAQALKNSNAESGGAQNASDHTGKPQEGV